MTRDELARWKEGEPCSQCDDTGYIETFTGGFWTGVNIRVKLTICDCPCGDDVRREQQEEPRP